MTREEREEYIADNFPKHFHKYLGSKIAIYGAGPYTEYVIHKFPEYNFIGVLDDNRQEKSICNKPIITMQDVLEQSVDVILVIAGASSTKAIFKKILNVCLEHNILLYNVYGKSLVELFGIGNLILPESEYYKVSETQLIEQIDAHESISFDIFDTLIMRKTMHPQDVFAILEAKAEQAGIKIENFIDKRIAAEREIYSIFPNLYEIYDHFMKLTGISEEEKKRLLELEIQIEKSLLIRRDKMVELFDYAVQSGKRVALISDMYLPKAILVAILSGLGIEGYDDIYVSCEYRQSKYTGLFSIYKDRVKSNSYLHIGDNEDADGYSAKMSDMDVFIIKSALELFRISSFREIENSLLTINEKSLVGMVIARAFQNPFVLYNTDGRPVITDVYDIGYLNVGPIISHFMLWLVDTIKEGNYDDILFAARDGHLIKRLYHIAVEKMQLMNVPQGVYLLTSRASCITASMDNDKLLKECAEAPFGCTPEQMLAKRFGLTPDEILPYAEELYPDMSGYAMAHRDTIFNRSKAARENYCRYLEKLGLKKDKNYALFDFVSSGTCQYLLGKFSEYQFEGTYFCRYHSEGFMQEKEDLQIQSYLRNSYHCDIGSRFFANFIFLETVLTSDQPSLRGFDKDGTPIFEEETRVEKQFQYEHRMQQAITDYFTDFLEHLYVPNENIKIEVCDMLYGLKDAMYTNLQCKILDELVLIDHMAYQTIKVVY